MNRPSSRVALGVALVVSVVLGVAAPASAATPVLADDTYKWFYWIGFVLALSFVGWLVMMAVGYYVKVLRPKWRGRSSNDRSRRRRRRRRAGARSRRLGARGAGRAPGRRARPALGLVPRRVAARRLRRGDRGGRAPRGGAHRAPRADRRARAVVDRASWVSANVRSMRRLLEPLTARVGARMAGSPIAPIGRRVAGTETGVLLGYLAQRVLGQYDLLVARRRRRSADAVYYVGGNILALEKRFAFRPRDFRLWIAIHECTHRAQFTGVPWMKPYFLSLVSETLGVVDPDPRRLVQALARAADEMRGGRNPLDDGGLVALLATDRAARRARTGPGAHVAARRARQRVMNRSAASTSPGRSAWRGCCTRGGRRGPCGRPAQAPRARVEDAPVRGRRGVRRGRRARSGPARDRRRVARSRVAPDARRAERPARLARARRR